MIGDVPEKAPRKCKRGKHEGQENGGLMVFTCSRCGGDFWQPADYSAELRQGDTLIDAGDYDAARQLVADTLRPGKPY